MSWLEAIRNPPERFRILDEPNPKPQGAQNQRQRRRAHATLGIGPSTFDAKPDGKPAISSIEDIRIIGDAVIAACFADDKPTQFCDQYARARARGRYADPVH